MTECWGGRALIIGQCSTIPLFQHFNFRVSDIDMWMSDFDLKGERG